MEVSATSTTSATTTTHENLLAKRQFVGWLPMVSCLFAFLALCLELVLR